MPTNPNALESAALTGDEVCAVRETTCCIVGGGPAGVMLGYLLARRGVPVLVLESHKDFDRDFRGDTIQPSTLEVLDQLGLADRMLETIPHGQIRGLKVTTPTGDLTLADISRLQTKYPYIATLPQAQFLEFLVEEARQFPSFGLVMGANVQRLVQEEGAVRGIRYRGQDNGWHEVRAALTVAADGRFSKIRGLAGLEPVKTAPPMDVAWFRLPRRPDDPRDLGSLAIHNGHFAVVLERAEEWQVGYVILKGSFQQLRGGGLERLHRSFAELVPWLADRVELLTDWKQVAVLSVESSRLTRWHEPGLLLIGDAAHVMSPVGGVGINVAIQDAVEAANLLAAPLQEDRLQEQDLAAVQARREWPVRVIQGFQERMQKIIVAQALQSGKPFRLPLLLRVLLRLPILRNIPARMIAFGARRVRVEEPSPR
ncbi:2-polyprenyl-6-methoxyphenol hydroxylase [Singulisphaera sp. GP187]|uniref:FAD-dependent oxidoreductase n=1 Tax=Singulisphaera sp. GP187 TaxID=1882752 RepID=UPI00092BCCDA|nr:FAD-dependent oxidoreductase [Singulisphaera sp. GP187]SIO36675.1 2-polyprenyl-6-methoxyphenol hydroxylase [Singulisphaera sp. GP187]